MFNRWKQAHPDYFSTYRQEHRAERSAYNRAYHQQHREERLERQRNHRQKPEVKQAHREYNQQYDATHPEVCKRKREKYLALHRDEVNQRKRLIRAQKRKLKEGEIQPMAIQPGQYENITLQSANIVELIPFLGATGKLHVYQNNYIVFEVFNGKAQRIPLFVNLALGDFSLPSSRELWVRTNDGEATFDRPYSNPLWKMEHGLTI